MSKNADRSLGEQRGDSKEIASRISPVWKSLNQAVQDFIESRYRKDGIEFYQEFMRDPVTGRSNLAREFTTFAEKGAYRDLLLIPGIIEQLQKTEMFDSEIGKIGLLLENRRGNLRNALGTEFSIEGAENRTKIENAIMDLEGAKLESLLKNQSNREKFLGSLFGKWAVPAMRRSFVEYIEALGLGNLDDTQRARLARFRELFTGMTLEERDIRDFLSCLGSDEASKRKFIQAFLPNVSLGLLVRENILTEQEARTAFLRHLHSGSSFNHFQNRSIEGIKTFDGIFLEAAENADLFDIRIPSKHLESNTLEKVLDTEALRASISEELERGFRELKEVVAWEFEIEEDPETGKFAPAYVKALQKNLVDTEGREVIAGLSLLENELLRGESIVLYRKDYAPDSETPKKDVHFRIKQIVDSKKSSERRVILQNLSPDGTVVSENSVNYADFYKILSSLKGADLLSEERWSKSVRVGEKNLRNEDGEILERNEEGIEFIQTFEELERKIDELANPEGAGRKLEAGRSFTLGKAGEEVFNVGTITRIDTEGKKVVIRNTLGTEEVFSYAQFFQIFMELKAKRLQDTASTMEGVLRLQKSSNRKKDFETIAIEDGKIVPENRRGEKNYSGIHHFVGNGGWGIEIGEIQGGQIQLRRMKNFKEGGGKEAHKADFIGELSWYPFETFHFLLEKYGAVPFDLAGEKELEKRELADVNFQTWGYIKRFFHHASFHDIAKGVMRVPEFIKHKLEHGSKHHAAHAALAFAKKIPFFPAEWLVDLRWEIETEDKKSVTEEVTRLTELSSPERRIQVERYLLDKGTADYQLIAGVLALLEKHGNLYPGAPLSQYEGSWLFFRRMPGESHQKEIFLHDLRKKVWAEEKTDVTEEFAIQEWLKRLAKEKHINQQYWVMVKKAWHQGSEAEFEMGGKEAKAKSTFEGRTKHALGKIIDHEFAHAIGAMEETWNKASSGTKDRMKLPFLFAMSNVRNSMHPNMLQKFVKMFDEGHAYPPLLFVQKAEKQSTFRNVVGALVASSGNSKMIADFANLKVHFTSESSDELTKACASFWDSHGAWLDKKLLLSVEDPEILARSNDPSDPNRKDFADYVEIVRWELGNSKLHPEELDLDMYVVENANWALINPNNYAGRFKINPGNAGLNGKLETDMFNWYAESVEKIRDVEPFKAAEDAPPEVQSEVTRKNREAKKFLYRRMHKAFLKYIHETVGSDKFVEDSNKPARPNGKRPLKIEGEFYMEKMAQYGFSVGPNKDIDRLFNGQYYEDWLERDFEKFINPPKTITDTVDETVLTAEQILQGASAANDPKKRRAA